MIAESETGNTAGGETGNIAERFMRVWHETGGPGLLLGGAVTGSRLYGTARPDSDHDWYGFYLSPTAAVLGLAPPADTVESTKGGGGDDYAFHEARKYLSILLKGNANAVEFLHAPGGWIGRPPEPFAGLAAELRDRRFEFLTTRVVASYLGYAGGQLDRLIRGRLVPGRVGETWKDVSHGLRLLLEADRIARGESPLVRLPADSPERAEVLAVRAGRVEPDAVLARTTRLTEAVLAARPWPLPEDGPRDWANDWLVRLRLAALKGSGPWSSSR